ncbi:BMC domain-containing protein [Clostridium oceanicum]|uniref:BMC domain-containing protein n=1 Tax=Clostridium oceanicum TaxID=1543 RepID=A0ABN1JMG6_9CLOT
MEALGLIETKGLLAAIEAADTMVKSADVSIIEKTYVGGGLVTISVTGDVGAVKASIEAATSAVRKLDEKFLVSDHVIPRPHEELENIIGPNTPPENPSSNDNKNIEHKEEVLKEANKEDDEEKIDSLDNREKFQTEEDIKDIPNIKNTESIETSEDIESLQDKEDVKTLKNTVKTKDLKETENHIKKNKDDLKTDIDKLHKLNLENLSKEDVDKLVRKNGLEKTILILAKLKVVKLRNLAREYKDFVITGRTISKAGKNSLIAKFKLYYEKN